MTASEALEVFGSQIKGTYYSSASHDYEEFILNYVRPWSYSYDIYSNGQSWTYQGKTFLYYRADNLHISSDLQYISVDIQPLYSIFDTEQIHSAIAFHAGGERAGLSSVFQSPSWDWFFDGSSYHLENSDLTSSGTHAYMKTDDRAFQFVCADFTSTSRTSGYSYRATFYGHSGSYCFLLIGLPYISDSASGATGTFTTASSGGSGGDVNVNVTVDMSGVESRLDDVAGGINDINSAIYGDEGADGLSSLDDLGVPSLQFDYSTVDDVGEVLDDVPAEVAAAGFWWTLAFDVLHFDSPFWAIVPLLCLFALMRYLLWRG